MNEYAMICDPGKRRDSAIFMVAKHTGLIVEKATHLGNVERLRFLMDIVFIDKFFKRSYEELVDNAVTLCGTRDLANNHDLLVDGNGVGEPVLDMMRGKLLSPISIIATGGEKVTEIKAAFGRAVKGPTAHVGKLQPAIGLAEIHVPKKDLVSAGQIVLQQNRCRIAQALRWREEFEKQLKHFKPPDGKKRKTWEADETEVHDDMVTTYLLCAWWFTRIYRDVILPDQPPAGSGKRTAEWDPMDYL